MWKVKFYRKGELVAFLYERSTELVALMCAQWRHDGMRTHTSDCSWVEVNYAN